MSRSRRSPAQWDSFSDERKRKWIKIASRYPKMSPDAQKRLHERMTEWVRMTPDQRRVARENYQVSKDRAARQARQNAWKAYQQLPEEQKERLAASEHKRRPSVVSAPPSGEDRSQGTRPPRQCTRARRTFGHAAGGARAAAAPLPQSPAADATGHSDRRELRARPRRCRSRRPKRRRSSTAPERAPAVPLAHRLRHAPPTPPAPPRPFAAASRRCSTKR